MVASCCIARLAFLGQQRKLTVKVKVEPTPISLVTVIRPPISRARFWLIARPRPVPSVERVSELSAW